MPKKEKKKIKLMQKNTQPANTRVMQSKHGDFKLILSFIKF